MFLLVADLTISSGGNIGSCVGSYEANLLTSNRAVETSTYIKINMEEHIKITTQ